MRPWIRERLQGRRKLAVLPMLWCLPYFCYAAGTGDLHWMALLRLLGVAAPLVLLYDLFPVSNESRFSWQDVLVAAWMITALLAHQLTGIWNIPVNLDFMGRLYLIAAGSWCWVFVRPVPELGYEFVFSPRTFVISAGHFAAFAVIAIPVSLAMHFTHWNPRHTGLLTFCADYVEIFLFIALLEELFFRGFLQSLISNNLGSTRTGHILVSCLFGLFHILHAPFPNWKYVLLATVAGWFYGSAYLKTRNLMAPVLAHAMVDTVWRHFF